MHVRYLASDGGGSVSELVGVPAEPPPPGWLWIDVQATAGSRDEVSSIADTLDLDALAVRDALDEDDLPKVGDFGNHLLVVLHGLNDESVTTYEVDCFLAATTLVTIHREPSPSIDALWQGMLTNPQLATGTADVVLSRLADVLTRRLLYVIQVFDSEIDRLITMALEADADLLGELMAVRRDLSGLRRAARPQREALDQLRTSPSSLITPAGQRRFSDVFDVAERTVHGLDNARSELAETLDAYRGAEARNATDVTKVLTIYAAIMLPLTLVVGFFGMNFVDLPGLDSAWGWVLVVALMAMIAIASIVVFAAVGWIPWPSAKAATSSLGRGLIEAARAPVQIGAAAYEATTKPLRQGPRS